MPSNYLKKLDDVANYFYSDRNLESIEPILDYYKTSGHKFIRANITIDHDGYDTYGPESDLITISVIASFNGETYRQKWYWEDWFQDTIPSAELIEDVTITTNY